jgi:hypothetical protein
MRKRANRGLRYLLVGLLSVALVLPASVPAQQQPPPPTQQPPAGTAQPFKPEELEQLAAPIALYPDSLMAQVLMASTYPLEVVQAARFLKANPNLKDDKLNEALKDKTWDDSVKSLVSFPPALTLMDQKLEWTQKLGDAFLAQQKELLDAIQRLRARAQAEGNLQTTPEQIVRVEPAVAPPAAPAQQPPAPAQLPAGPAQQPAGPAQQPATSSSVIVIEPADPQVVYVPSYNPTVVYGAWPYPAYPPYYPYPPGYAWGAAALTFGFGMAAGAALWGGANWGGGEVDIDVNKNNNFSNNVNRGDRAQQRPERGQGGQGQRGDRGQWKHNPENRQGVQYRDQATQQKFNKAGDQRAAQSRESFRGREQGAGQPGTSDRSRGGDGRGSQAGTSDRSRGGDGRGGQSFGGGQGGGRDAGAFQGMGSGGSAKSFSDRGSASRGGGGQSFGASGGGGRSSGGGGRSGGGGGRSGGGGGRRR